jgi:hypothetical protein
MAASLWPRLVLEVHTCDAGFFVVAYRAPDVDGIAVTGVRIRDDGQTRRIGDTPRVVDHFGRGQETDVGRTESREARAEPGHVYGIESFERDEAGGERVRDTRSDDAARLGEE